ncbi:COG4705 family protein [Microlunatus ginsengisoli]|uniref:Membrane protein n=1 Tax=Microlunatus ginsengisoli TaxID=363863 RepID=A0ABP7AJU9_9ACTN
MASSVDTDPRRWAVKVPEITLLFWLIKVLTTGTGEALSDFLAAWNIPVAATLALLGLLGALGWQLWTRRYSPPPYWLAVSMVAVAGTMAADVVHLIGVPYLYSSLLCVAAVVVLFVAWHRSTGTLSIHSVDRRSRELFYWATVSATFALGTAVGDLVAISFGWGYLVSGLVFTVLIMVPLVGWRWFGLNSVVAFWMAYVLTRPLGASYADWLGKPDARGGLGLGDGTVALVGALAIAAGVAYLTVRQRRTRDTAVDDVGAGYSAAGDALPAVEL